MLCSRAHCALRTAHAAPRMKIYARHASPLDKNVHAQTVQKRGLHVAICSSVGSTSWLNPVIAAFSVFLQLFFDYEARFGWFRLDHTKSLYAFPVRRERWRLYFDHCLLDVAYGGNGRAFTIIVYSRCNSLVRFPKRTRRAVRTKEQPHHTSVSVWNSAAIIMHRPRMGGVLATRKHPTPAPHTTARV